MRNTSAKCNEDACLPILHLVRVELRCKAQEKLHHVTAPYGSFKDLALFRLIYTMRLSCAIRILAYGKEF